MTTPNDSKSFAQTLDRGLETLERVMSGVGRLDDLAAEMNLSRSVVQRLLSTLARRGYIQQVNGQGWKVGLRLVELAGDAISQVDPAGLLQEQIALIAEEVEDSVHLGVLQGDDILYIAKAHGQRDVQMISRVGRRIPAQNTALGKAILSHGDIDAAVSRFSTDSVMTPRSLTSAAEYRAALLAAHKSGFAIDEEEATLGIVCVAVALPSHGGKLPSAALSVSVPTAYMERDRMAEIVAVLEAHAPAVGRVFQAVGQESVSSFS